MRILRTCLAAGLGLACLPLITAGCQQRTDAVLQAYDEQHTLKLYRNGDFELQPSALAPFAYGTYTVRHDTIRLRYDRNAGFQPPPPAEMTTANADRLPTKLVINRARQQVRSAPWPGSYFCANIGLNQL